MKWSNEVNFAELYKYDLGVSVFDGLDMLTVMFLQYLQASRQKATIFID